MHRMIQMAVAGLLIAGARADAATSTVEVPWEQFQQLYHESLERTLRAELTPPATNQQLHVLEEAVYRISADTRRASGSLQLQGRVLEGVATPIPLPVEGLILTGAGTVEGGTLLRTDHGAVALLPSGPGAFSVQLAFVAAVRSSEDGYRVVLATPRALRNAVHVELAEGLQLSDAPGLATEDGAYHLDTERMLELRFAPRPAVPVVKPRDTRDYETVAAPAPVLDELTFCAAFEENGAVLSTLMLQVPATPSGMFELSPVEGARLWSLEVDGRTRKLYRNEAGSWLIPVPAERASQVTLALIQDSAKLGLQGRVEATLPATGLPARRLRVCIGLPERVVLTSLEAPLSTAAQERWTVPPDFAGKPYRFGRAFYRGEEIRMAIAYREPVKDENEKGNTP